MIKAVYFDFFDVVHADYQKRWLAENGLERVGGFAEASDLLDLGEISVEEYIARYAQHGNTTPEAISEAFGRLSSLDEGILDTIRQLNSRDGVSVGLISNAHSAEIRPLLERNGLLELFDDIVISSEARVAKPHPAIFNLALTRLGVQPAEAVFVDDSAKNVEAATQVGMHALHYLGDIAPLHEHLATHGVILDVATRHKNI